MGLILLCTFSADATKSHSTETHEEGVYTVPSDNQEVDEATAYLVHSQAQPTLATAQAGSRNSQMPGFQSSPVPGSFLGVASNAGSSDLLGHLTDVVQAQSQALMSLERQQAHFAAQDLAFEAQEADTIADLAQRVPMRKCKTYNRNGAPSPKDQSSCLEACTMARGFNRPGAYETRAMYEPTTDGGLCDCAQGSRKRTICNDNGSRMSSSASILSAIVMWFTWSRL